MLIEAQDETQFREALRSPRPVLADFWAEWLGPCRIAGELFEIIAKDYEGRLDFLRVDSDRMPGLLAEHAVKSLPTVIVFSGGREIKRLTGPYPLQDLRPWLESLLAPNGK